MENVNKISILGILGVVGSFIANLLGGWDTALQTLVIFMAIDYIMGLVVAGVFKKSQKSEHGALESKVGWRGLLKKGTTLAVVLIAAKLDILIDTDFVRTAVIIGYILNELISITENAGLMGVYIPPAIVKAIDILKSKETGGGENGD